ncbi:hypothetical protein PGB90_006250 [Kerria lacca]
MQFDSEGTKQEHLHWMCSTPNENMKLNLSEFYKAALTLPENSEEKSLCSCADRHRKSLTYEQKGPYAYPLYTPIEQEPKCLALDLFFEEPVTVSEIKFQNYYVAFLNLLIKYSNCREWDHVIQHRQLMPYPHFEEGSKSYFELVPETSSWNDVTEIRFILQQPSPNWKRFYIENLFVFSERKSNDLNEDTFMVDLIKRTTEALNMEGRYKKKVTTTVPFHIGTSGYEIDRLQKL